MPLTQKYKQQQRQVRVVTNASNYLKGMFYTDTPLSEGYSKVLINFDIDSLTGKLIPRKGLQSLGVIKPVDAAKSYLTHEYGYNTIIKSKVCSVSDNVDKRKVNRYLQSVLYNTETKGLNIATCDAEVTENSKFKITPFSLNLSDVFTTPEPYVIDKPNIHGVNCAHKHFFEKPVGTFAFGDSYYTFLEHSNYTVTKDTLPAGVTDYTDLQNSYATGTPGHYYVFTSGVSEGVIAYYDVNGDLQIWTKSEDLLKREVFADTEAKRYLCYTRLGKDIKADPEIELLDTNIVRTDLVDDQYYACIIKPARNNPTEAASWGYNMLLDDPYDFKCENTAVNLVTILGILPYDKDGKINLTPRKNESVTLKGFYRAPDAYYSDLQNGRFYATTKRYITVPVYYETTHTSPQTGITYYTKSGDVYVVFEGTTFEEGVTYYTRSEYHRDPKTLAEIGDYYEYVTTRDTSKQSGKAYYTLSDNTYTEFTGDAFEQGVTYYERHYFYNFGDWWYVSDLDKYYIIMPDNAVYKQKLALYGETQPAASVKLNVLTSGTENSIRVVWEKRDSGKADWDTLSDETFKLSERTKDPFIISLDLSSDETLVRLSVLDPEDTEHDEQYVLSTNTIGISAMSDDLANSLNLDAKVFDLKQATGMCEWENRLVLWGVPDALNTIFISDINNPTFFPYPNNIDTFTDPIIAVHNYGNELLVLTTSALYRLTWDTEGTGWTHKLVQQNLHVTEADTYMSCVIKNMFFFKSGEYYYMMVPKVTSKAAAVGETTIAPISKPIEGLLDNFHDIVYNLIEVMYTSFNLTNTQFKNTLVNYFSYVDNMKVVINYVYDLSGDVPDSKYLYVQLIYDTEVRTWSMKTFEAPHMLYASHADALQQDRFIDLTPALDSNNLVIQYYKFQNHTDTSIQNISSTGAIVNTAIRIIKNYQYLDTGNREINTELKKRFREFQFKIKNNTATNLGFYTSFVIDGSIRRDLQKYKPSYILDQTTGEAMIIIERTLDTSNMTYKTTNIERVLVPERMLQDEGELTPTTLNQPNDADQWILNQSAFPGRTLWKIRMAISGKGYTPRVILLSTNEQDFEILGHSFVYRTMNAR